MRRSFALLASLFAAGCSSPEIVDGYFSCNAPSECPEGFNCIGNRCTRGTGSIDAGVTPGLDASDPGVDAGAPGIDAGEPGVDAGCSAETCNDGIPCTIDTCSSAMGCQHAPDNSACPDPTTGMCDVVRGCVGPECRRTEGCPMGWTCVMTTCVCSVSVDTCRSMCGQEGYACCPPVGGAGMPTCFSGLTCVPFGPFDYCAPVDGDT